MMDHKTAALFNMNLPAAAALVGSLQSGLNPQMAVSALEFTGPIEADAKLIDYRGEQVAGFEIESDTMICLPQAYELFLKNLVGGLHTVYTKLKRLEIVPRVCNVEQVRALRSLGAIQPGVNRCKLISCKDFDILYQDCTSTSSRPGRPPKTAFPKSSPGSTSGIDQWNSIFKKPRFGDSPFNDHKSTPNVAASMNAANLFGSQMGSLPFLPFTAQQLMINQMMTAAAAANSHLAGFTKDEHNLDMCTDTSPALTNTDNNQRNDSESKDINDDKRLWIDDSDLHPLNLKKSEVVENGDDHQSDHTDNSMSDNPDDVDSLTSPQTTEEPETSSDCVTSALQQHPWSAAFGNFKPDENQALGNFSSVQSLLLNVLGLIEIAAATARTQEEQTTKEKTELSTLLNQEKTERTRVENQLREERRQKKIYLRRWRQAKRSKNEIQAQLLTILEAQQRNQRNQQETRLNSEQNIQTTVIPTITTETTTLNNNETCSL